jgi:hypothetical protein
MRAARAKRFGAVSVLALLALTGCAKPHDVSFGGLTMSVPSNWKTVDSKEAKPGEMSVLVLAARRPITAATGMVAVQENWNGTASAERARAWQKELPNFGDGGAKGTERFEVQSGKVTSVCVEGHVSGDRRYMLCEIVGTPLQVNYSGATTYEKEVRAMLGTLR